MVVAQSAAGHETDLRRIGIHPDFWFPVALSSSLRREKTLAVAFAGAPIVLVRTRKGHVFALEDRCAHRQMPLSMGVVVGERLRCSYHSWVYDRGGRCAAVPYLPEGEGLPSGVRAYPCREAYGLVYVFPGDPARAQRVAFPDVPGWDDPLYRTMYFERDVACHYSFMHENLMDMNHQFLHRRIMGSIRPTLLKASGGDDWMEVTYRFDATGGKRHFTTRFMVRDPSQDPELPNSQILTIRTQYPYQSLSVELPGGKEEVLRLWVCYVPVDAAQRANRSFGLLRLRKPRIPGLVHLIWPFMRRFTDLVFQQDRMAVEAEQQAHDAQGADWNQEVFPVIRDLKELLRRCGGDPVAVPPAQ